MPYAFPSAPRANRRVVAILASLILAACAGPRSVDFSPGHNLDTAPPIVVRPVMKAVAPHPTQDLQAPVETYTVVVKEVPAIDLLFSLARDAGLNLDLQADSNKTVTMNALQRPLAEILSRIAKQSKLRYRLRGNDLIVQDDSPYWHNYLVDYVNISRDSDGEVGVATQIATSGGSVGESSGSIGDGQGNLSKTIVKNSTRNDFWASLEEGLEALVKSDAQVAGGNSPQDQDPVIVNKMSGVVTVLGDESQQQRVRTYLDNVMVNSQRQVLIEMTIVEVELNDNYQAGVDWQRLSNNGGLDNNGVSVRSSLLGAGLSVPPFFSLGYNDVDSDGSAVSATVRLLQEFGDTKVLSSPKIMALNNQTALLKVVNENVFFTVELDIREATADIPERRTFTSELHTVPVGLVLSVTPQISAHGYVSLNVRPTISRITGFAIDPAPRLAGSDFDNLIPEIQVREIESLLQVKNGHTVILGGLMQNERKSVRNGIPGLSRIPKIGNLFAYTSDNLIKTELVIFLKTTIIENGAAASPGNRLSDYVESADWSSRVDAIEYR
jgi:general secretion pathway protein D